MAMLPLSTNEEGECVAFPDVCDTPAGDEVVPVAYPNSALLEQADMTTVSTTVFIVGKNAVTENTFQGLPILDKGAKCLCDWGGEISAVEVPEILDIVE